MDRMGTPERTHTCLDKVKSRGGNSSRGENNGIFDKRCWHNWLFVGKKIKLGVLFIVQKKSFQVNQRLNCERGNSEAF